MQRETRVPLMLPLREASARTGLSYYTLRSLCLEDRIVFVKAGTKYLVNMDKLVDYLNGDASEA